MSAKCYPHEMMKVIRRNVPINESELRPEQKLILAIIEQAVADLTKYNQKKDKYPYRRSSILFFRSGWFRHCCGLVGLNPDNVISLLQQGGFLSLKMTTDRKE